MNTSKKICFAGGILVLLVGLLDLSMNAFRFYQTPITFDSSTIMHAVTLSNLKGLAACFVAMAMFKFGEKARLPGLALVMSVFTFTMLWLEASGSALYGESALIYYTYVYAVMPALGICTIVLLTPDVLKLYRKFSGFTPAEANTARDIQAHEEFPHNSEYRKTGS